MVETSCGEPRVVRFGAFEVDLRSEELRRGGMRVRLSGKPFQLLALLLERPGEILLREELRATLWPADTFVDFEHGLNATASRLRDALGDSARNPRFVETIPRRGYRFVYPVHLSGHPPTSPDRIMLAVLMFENATGDPEQEYFSDGFTEELLTLVGRLEPRRLRVIARTSVTPYKNTNKDVKVIGTELGVQFVVEGSVCRDRERVRVTVRLIDTADRSCLWGESFERDIAAIADLQRDIAEQISHTLNVAPDAQMATSHRFSSESLEAYLRGRSALNQRTPEAVRQAIELFRTASALEPGLAAAHDGCAQAYALAVDYGVMEPREGCTLARNEGSQALRLDSRSTGGHAALAFVRHRFDWDWEGAEEEYRNALRSNPSTASAHQGYAEFLSQMGRHQEALDQILAARMVDPLSPVILAIEGWILYHATRMDEAMGRCQAALKENAAFALARYVLGRSLLRVGEVDKALTELRQAVVQSENNPFILAGFGYALGMAGRRKNARELLEVLIRSSNRPFVSPYLRAKVHTGLGEHDRALDCLEEGFRQRSGWMVDLQVDPEIDPLRAEPRFMKLVAQMKFPNGADRPTRSG